MRGGGGRGRRKDGDEHQGDGGGGDEQQGGGAEDEEVRVIVHRPLILPGEEEEDDDEDHNDVVEVGAGAEEVLLPILNWSPTDSWHEKGLPLKQPDTSRVITKVKERFQKLCSCAGREAAQFDCCKLHCSHVGPQKVPIFFPRSPFSLFQAEERANSQSSHCL